ncbi:MAG: hypothetical protein ABI557_20325 [Aureliella sp.]
MNRRKRAGKSGGSPKLIVKHQECTGTHCEREDQPTDCQPDAKFACVHLIRRMLCVALLWRVTMNRETGPTTTRLQSLSCAQLVHKFVGCHPTWLCPLRDWASQGQIVSIAKLAVGSMVGDGRP